MLVVVLLESACRFKMNLKFGVFTRQSDSCNIYIIIMAI